MTRSPDPRLKRVEGRLQHLGGLAKQINEEHRSCFYCMEGWVFLGSIGPDGEEVYEAVRCRRCGGRGRL